MSEQFPRVDPDGTVHCSADIALPFSNFASDAARTALHARSMRLPEGFSSGNPFAPDRVLATREWFDGAARAGAQEMARRYPARTSQDRIAGVLVDIVVPEDGETDADRVLVNLHGGGFVFGARWTGLIESLPIATLGRIKVVTVDYRMSPEHMFPAASEDVASVYRALLEDYRPENIGIYGCSAGGFLGMQAVAWFRHHDLPMPGAVGVFCAGGHIAKSGDSAYSSSLFTGRRIPSSTPSTAAPLRVHFTPQDGDNPLASPVLSPEILGGFPPSLIISGTRDSTLSNAVYTHSRLVAAGASADLHVWEGMDHAFFYSAETPEAREMYDVVVKFFERRLGIVR